MERFIVLSLVNFAITLILTKSQILANKREFVQKRYESSKVGNMRPGLIHRWWHAMWTCPMCSGFWFAIIITYPYSSYGLYDPLVVFSLNWLLHCVENFFFQNGKILEKRP